MSGAARSLDRLLAALPGGGELFARACDGVRDWEALYARAVRQRVHAVVADAALAGRVDLPTGLAERMARDVGAQCLWQAHLRAELDRALAALDGAGVRACALKGPVLAERLYASAELRPTTDVDVLVEPAELERAVDALGEIGLAREQSGELGPHPFEVRMSGASEVTVEVHFRAQVSFGTALDASDLLDRAREHRTAGGARCLVAAPEEEFVYLAMHAANHGFDRLLMLYDLKLLCAASPGFDWEAVADLARRRRLMSVVAFACRLLGERLGVSVPALGPARRGRPAARALFGALDRAPYVPLATGLASAALRAALFDSPVEGGQYLRRRVRTAVELRVARARRRLSGRTRVEGRGSGSV